MSNPADSLSDLQPAAAGRRPGVRLAARWGLFLGIGLLLYLGLYAWAESVVRETGDRNRFFRVAMAPRAHYDRLILGASHAMPLDYADMTATLEAASGSSIMNLSLEGGGVLPARFMLDYFLARHSAGTVIFFLDSFAFYTPQWNEDRLDDPGLFRRAPLDPDLAAALWTHPETRNLLPGYLSGFYKVNDGDRRVPDRPDAEAKFDRTYKPVAQIDRQRVAYLYPETIDHAAFRRYLAAFEALIIRAREAGLDVVVVKPPTPARYRDKLPEEPAFDAAIASLLARHEVPLHDLSLTIPEDPFYYDTDHLNRAGITRLAEQDFVEILRAPDAAKGSN